MLLLGVIQAQAAGLAPAGAGSFDLLQSEVLGSSQASVTFSNLGDYAADYQHLQIRAVARSDRGITVDGIIMRLNSDTGANYASHGLVGDGSTVTSVAETSASSIAATTLTAASATTNAFGAFVCDILDPFETTKYTTARFLGGHSASANFIRLDSGHWRNTNAVTSITFDQAGGSNFVQYSRFSIYGWKAA